MTACRFFAYHSPNPITQVSFLEYDKLTSNVLTFVASTHTRIYKPAYTLTEKEEAPCLAVSIKLGYVGSASLNTVATLADSRIGEVYAENVNQVVTVSKESRKPVPLAEWWKNKYSKAADATVSRLIIPAITVGTEHYTHTLKVAWDDIDGYQHTTYTSYIKFCLEAAMEACTHGFYSAIRTDVLKHHIHLMEISFKGETRAGDELTIKTWENEDDARQLYFDIAKQDSTVFQSSFTFHE